MHTAISGTFTRVSDPGSVGAEWRALEAVASGTFFTSWGWIGPWATQASRRTTLQLFRVRRDGQTIGLAFVSLCPATRRRGGVRVTQLQLNEHSVPGGNMIIEHNGILALAGDLRECWDAFARAALSSRLGWDEVALRSLGPEQASAAKIAFRGLREEVDTAVPAWVVALTPSHANEETLVASFKKKARQQMRQSLREFEALGPIELRIAESKAEAESFFTAMEALHRLRWESVGKLGSFANRLWRAFHQVVIEVGLPRGEVVLARLSVGGSAIGYVYGIEWRGSLYAIQTGFKMQERNALRTGFVSHFRLMQAMAARGVTRYDFLPDEENSYKRLLAESENVLTSVRYQRPRLIFWLERIAMSVRDRRATRHETERNEPTENEPS